MAINGPQHMSSMAKEQVVAPLSTGLCVGYGLGSLGTGLYGTVPGLLLLYFMTQVLGIEAGLAGTAIFLPKVWDVIIDPFMGMATDRTRSRWGRRRPWLLAGALLLPLSFWAMFTVPALDSSTQRGLYVSALYVLAALGFTFFQIPYIAMPAELSPDPHERTRIVSYRMAFMTAGILAGGALAPMLVKWGGGGEPGYRLMGLVLAAVLLASMLGSFWMTAKAPLKELAHHELLPGLRESLSGLKSRAFLCLAGGSALVFCGVSVVLAAVPFYTRYILGRGEETVTLLFVCLVLPAMLTMPLWVKLARRIGKRLTYILSVSLFALGTLIFLVGASVPIWVLYVVTAGMGVAYAGSQLLPFSMLTDVIQYEGQRSGLRQEGVFTGLWTATEGIGMAGGALVAGAILQVMGFQEASGGVEVAQTPQALQGVVWVMSLIPSALCLLGLPLLSRYEIQEAHLLNGPGRSD
ncbi:MAG: MFS transporter [Myxococcota bacterium]